MPARLPVVGWRDQRAASRRIDSPMPDVFSRRFALRFTFPALALAALLSTTPVDDASGVEVGVLRIMGPGVATALSLTADDLEAMGTETLTTETHWTDRAITFRGVPLAAILDAAGAHGSELRAEAVNDYFIDFAVEDALAWGALVAFEADGARMQVRDKGPYWIVYPWSDRPELDNVEVRMTSVWQLMEIKVR
jgi:hypothetical protein